ncbi:MAG: SDR family oxidoreductase [Actinobacteria bacterium]|nr:SDR family oxidoreductase [Actinomycetota bacterium]
MIISHEGRVALITGAGSGIGRAITLRLAGDGARVAVVDVKADAAQATVHLVEQVGGTAIALTADVRDRAQVSRAVEDTVAQLGRLDLLANNAGVVRMANFENLTDDEWDFVVDVNLKGQFIVGQLASRAMTAGGAIVNLATIESEVVVSSSGSCQPHYNASKGGVTMLTKAMAVELSAKGIRVNAVAPGPINTGFAGGDITSPEAMAFIGQRVLVHRVGEPEDVANLVSFLLSDQASFIDGVQIPIDGGWLTR